MIVQSNEHPSSIQHLVQSNNLVIIGRPPGLQPCPNALPEQIQNILNIFSLPDDLILQTRLVEDVLCSELWDC